MSWRIQANTYRVTIVRTHKLIRSITRILGNESHLRLVYPYQSIYDANDTLLLLFLNMTHWFLAVQCNDGIIWIVEWFLLLMMQHMLKAFVSANHKAQLIRFYHTRTTSFSKQTNFIFTTYIFSVLWWLWWQRERIEKMVLWNISNTFWMDILTMKSWFAIRLKHDEIFIFSL